MQGCSCSVVGKVGGAWVWFGVWSYWLVFRLVTRRDVKTLKLEGYLSWVLDVMGAAGGKGGGGGGQGGCLSWVLDVMGAAGGKGGGGGSGRVSELGAGRGGYCRGGGGGGSGRVSELGAGRGGYCRGGGGGGGVREGV